MDEVVLPYADAETGRSSGWSGSDTSRDRAHERDLSGETASGQEQVLDLLRVREGYGVTWAEVAQELDVHHGTASGLLSNLHSGELILRLSETRNRSKVYVLPSFRFDRDIESPKRNLNVRKIAAMRRIIKQAQERGLDSLPLTKVIQIIEYREKE